MVENEIEEQGTRSIHVRISNPIEGSSFDRIVFECETKGQNTCEAIAMLDDILIRFDFKRFKEFNENLDRFVKQSEVNKNETHTK